MVRTHIAATVKKFERRTMGKLEDSGLLADLYRAATEDGKKNGRAKEIVGQSGAPLGEERASRIRRVLNTKEIEAIGRLFGDESDGWRLELENILKQDYLTLYNAGGRGARLKLRVSGSFNVRNPFILDALAERANLISGISDNVFDRLLTVVAEEGFVFGKSPIDVGRALEDEFDFLSTTRARRIAHQETLTITEEAETTLWEASGVPFKRWLTTLDGRERPPHFDLHGQIKALDEPFEVDGIEIMEPGDPAAPPDMTMGCRCAKIPIVTADQIFSDANVWRGDVDPDEFSKDRIAERAEENGKRSKHRYDQDLGRWVPTPAEGGESAAGRSTGDRMAALEREGVTPIARERILSATQRVEKWARDVKDAEVNERYRVLVPGGRDIRENPAFADTESAFIGSWLSGDALDDKSQDAFPAVLMGKALTGTLTEDERVQLAGSKYEPGGSSSSAPLYSEAWVVDRYAATQELLRRRGIDEVTLYRGVRGPQAEALRAKMNAGEPISLGVRGLSSFTTEWNVAERFANPVRGDAGLFDPDGIVVEIRVPRERIFAHHAVDRFFGNMDEEEVVVWDPDGVIQGGRDVSAGKAATDVIDIDDKVNAAWMAEIRRQRAGNGSKYRYDQDGCRICGVSHRDGNKSGCPCPEPPGRPGPCACEGGAGASGAGTTVRSSDYKGSVNTLHQRAKELDREITPAFQQAVSSAGGKAVGLDYRIKASLERAEQKLREKAAESGTGAENPEQHLHDMLRYTATWPPEEFGQGRDRFLAEMQRAGFNIYDSKDKNYWQGEFYKGDNYVFAHKSGFTFEVQMHTPDSFRTKEAQHGLYEEFRAPGTSAERRKDLVDEMRSQWRGVVTPREAMRRGHPVVEG